MEFREEFPPVGATSVSDCGVQLASISEVCSASANPMTAKAQNQLRGFRCVVAHLLSCRAAKRASSLPFMLFDNYSQKYRYRH